MQSLPGWGATLLTLAIVAAIVLAGHYLSRPVFRFVHAAKLPEMSTFISLLMVLGIAFLMMLVGLSPALGTFVAGVVLANSEFRHQLEADLSPFKGLLMGLFFMTVGVGINFSMLLRAARHGVFADLGLDGAEGADPVGHRLCLPAEAARPLAVLAEPGAGRRVRLSDHQFRPHRKARCRWPVGQMALLVISLSMLLTPLLFIAYDWLVQALCHRVRRDQRPMRSTKRAGSSWPASGGLVRWSTGWCAPRGYRPWFWTTTWPPSKPCAALA